MTHYPPDSEENRERKVVVVHNYNSEVHSYDMMFDYRRHLMTRYPLDDKERNDHRRRLMTRSTVAGKENRERNDHRRRLMTQNAVDGMENSERKVVVLVIVIVVVVIVIIVVETGIPSNQLPEP